MADIWLDGYRKRIIRRPSGAYSTGGKIRVPKAPSRIIIHDTETKWVPGYGPGWPPHITCGVGHPQSIIDKYIKPGTKWKEQHVPLNLSAYALRNAGPQETNHMGRCIQIEWITYARYDKANELYDILAEVVADVIKAFPDDEFDLEIHPDWWPPYYTQKARMSESEWAKFNGFAGHVHVPASSGNTHWDPGKFDPAKLISRVRAILGEDSGGAPPPPPVSKPTPIPWPNILRPDTSMKAASVLRGHLATLGYGPRYFWFMEKYTSGRARLCAEWMVDVGLIPNVNHKWAGLVGPNSRKALAASLEKAIDKWPTLEKGDRRKEVNDLRGFFAALGYTEWKWVHNDMFTSYVKDKVEWFQAAEGLVVDGVVGPKTRAALKAALRKTLVF